MKEVSAVFQDGFRVGLMPDLTLNTQAEYLTQCYNLVPGTYGIEPRKTIDLAPPHFVSSTSSWPNPFLISLARFDLLIEEGKLTVLRSVDASQPWAATELGTPTGKPHIADFMQYVVMANESDNPNKAILIRDDYPEFGWSPYFPRFHTCCNFKGQLIFGDFWNLTGPDQSSCKGTNNPRGTVIAGENLVGWSKIGSLEFEFSLGNEVGYAPMPWRGKVLALLPLVNEVVVYGSNGVAKLSPEKDPVTTFGVSDFGDIGVLNRNCVAGDFSRHLFLGIDYNLYLVEPVKPLSGEGRAPKRVGYSFWMKQLVNPIMSYDPAFGQWWIGDANRCFIFTGEALGEASVTPSHLNRLDGKLLGYYKSHGDQKAVVETSPLSFNSKGIKTLMNIEVDVQTGSGEKVYGSVNWLSDYMREFRKGRRILLDPRGSFFPITAGTEFRVCIEAPDYESFILSKMWLHFKNTDKTFSRGVINAGATPE